MNMGIRLATFFIGWASISVTASETPVDGRLRETKFDKDLIPGSAGIGASIPLSNGRQIVRNRAGSWFVGFDSLNGPRMAVAVDTRSEGRHFKAALDLGRLLEMPSQESEGFSMAIDSHDNLHVVWGTDTGLFHSWCDVSGENGYRKVSEQPAWKTAFRKPGFEKLADAGARLGDLACEPDGRLWVVYSRDGSIFAACPEAGRWRASLVAEPFPRWMVISEPPDHMEYEIRMVDEGCRDPVLEIDEKGVFHLAFAHRWELYYTFSADGETWTARPPERPRPEIGMWDSPFPDAERVAYAHAFNPSLILYRGQPLVVYQHEGMVDLDPFSKDYVKERWTGVANVGYAVREETDWRRGYISKSKEIMVKRLPPGEGHLEKDDPNFRKTGIDGDGRVFLAAEEQWRPAIGRDRFGIPWAVWNDTTRRYNYFSRWMNDGFDDKREWRGAFYGLSKHSTVEKQAPPESNELGTLVLAADRIYFCRMPVASIDPAEDRYFQVLDLLEFSSARNIRTGLTPLERNPASPVFGPNPDPDEWDSSRVSANVTYDEDAQVYRMRYGGAGYKNWVAEDGDVTNSYSGYAESSDGLHFERKKVGLVDLLGSKDNNLLIPVRTSFEDKEETDPRKRYKAIITYGPYLRKIGKEGRILSAYSSDEIHWVIDEDITGTNKAPSSDHGAGPSYEDPFDFPERRFKSIHRAYNLSGRAVGMSYAPALQGPWDGFEDVLDYYEPYRYPPHGDRQRSGWLILEAGGGIGEDQVYGGGGRIEDGIYLLKYVPVYFDGRYSISLAMSRDGVNFYRMKNGESSLSPSGAGNWDSGIVAGGGSSIEKGEDLWIYYTGTPWHHNTMVRPFGSKARLAVTGGVFGRPEWFVGIATIRNHAWTFAEVVDSTIEGTLESIPVSVEGMRNRRLLVNVDGIGDHGKIGVELLDADTMEPVPGFKRADCRPIATGLDVPVTWKGGEWFANLRNDRVVIRFYLSGASARFHAFRFSK
jgi:hypothetical protein